MVVMVQLWPRRRLGGAGPNRFDRLGLAVFDTYLKKWAGDGTAEGGVFDGDVPSSSFSITVEDMELHHFASLTSCLFYFSGKKKDCVAINHFGRSHGTDPRTCFGSYALDSRRG